MNNKTLTQILKLAQQKLPAEQHEIFTVFLKEFYADAFVDDFAERSSANLLSSALAQWQLMYQRGANQIKLKVFNPSLEKDGWECANTVILLASDDMPFLVDSLQMVLNRLGCNIYTIVHLGGIKVERDGRNYITQVIPIKSVEKASLIEAPVYIEIEKQADAKILKHLVAEIQVVLDDVRAAVTDWPIMKDTLQAAENELEQASAHLVLAKKNEALWFEAEKFLSWLINDNFIFLGYRCYNIVTHEGEGALSFIEDSSLGFLRKKNVNKIYRYFSELPKEAHEALNANDPLLLVKTNTVSNVHKPVYTDSIVIKRYDQTGKVIGIHRFIGLYARTAYYNSIRHIPYLRYKANSILQRFAMPHAGYSSKTLLHILETFPRDDFIQANIDDLYTIATGIFQLHERRLIKLFIRKDVYGKYISCLVYLPRDNFNTDLRVRIQEILMRTFAGTSASFDLLFSESILARIRFVINIDTTKTLQYDFNAIEQEIIRVATSWYDGVRDELLKTYPRKTAEILAQKYFKVFSSGYCETFLPSFAVSDIEKFEYLLSAAKENNSSLAKETFANLLAMSFYHLPNAPIKISQFKLFYLNQAIALSDTLPLLENLGFRIIKEQSYQVQLSDGGEIKNIYISDFSMIAQQQNALVAEEDIYNAFIAAFTAIWRNQAENDGFNRLLLLAGLEWRQIALIRAYAKYLRQIKFPYSQQYIENTLARYPQMAQLLIAFFHARFAPELAATNSQAINELRTQINAKLDEVVSLDEERIILSLLALIDATVRTNFYQNKEYISFKFASKNIPDLPRPRPLFEIFVYAPHFEGVHLRMAKVARGGLRWSDRREDFRTEILGLVKAQQVKNAVIVPYGAKGGFVLKKTISSRELLQQEAVKCYSSFVNALLDLTDNIVDEQILPPENVVRYDEDDPYLVVAADKGTASFSNIANSIAASHEFWLGDAFASGGATGYDHKKIGITARGAWEAVKHHFYQIGINVDVNDFTVIGIGDMSGDVFGNGMLLSQHIKLVGAFNHQHIFLDPNPDIKLSYVERMRLFNLPQSTWGDYDKKLLSAGGGIYLRSAKTIRLSAEAKALLGVNKDVLAPNEVIKALLKAPVDLLWNGGIGTYIKASYENHDTINDRSNDAVRVDANELRCKIIAEGGNLGVSQLARIEYGLAGGICNTDFIDNSGGVDCSDHEVNSKILLNVAMRQGKLTEKARNKFLAQMADEVSKLVLINNYRQTRTIGILTAESRHENELQRLINYMEKQEAAGKLDRELEFLPNTKTLQERKNNGLGFSRAEISVLLAYSKLILKEEILASGLIDDAYFAVYLAKEFPQKLVQKFGQYLPQHRLRREIISTHLSNDFITDLGISFMEALKQDARIADASLSDIIKAYVIAKEVLASEKIFVDIRNLDFVIDAVVQKEIIKTCRMALGKSVQWFLRFLQQGEGDKQLIQQPVTKIIKIFREKHTELQENIIDLLPAEKKTVFSLHSQKLVAKNIPQNLARSIVSMFLLEPMLDSIKFALINKMSVLKMGRVCLSLVKDLMEA